MMYERDPEEVGPEHPDDLDLRMRVIENTHEFLMGGDGKCSEIVYRRDGKINRCNLDSWSVLHYDEYREQHDHGGYDCMCFEGDF
jgi:hypothetical protein